jgi:hypothetical protein
MPLTQASDIITSENLSTRHLNAMAIRTSALDGIGIGVSPGFLISTAGTVVSDWRRTPAVRTLAVLEMSRVFASVIEFNSGKFLSILYEYEHK